MHEGTNKIHIPQITSQNTFKSEPRLFFSPYIPKNTENMMINISPLRTQYNRKGLTSTNIFNSFNHECSAKSLSYYYAPKL